MAVHLDVEKREVYEWFDGQVQDKVVQVCSCTERGVGRSNYRTTCDPPLSPSISISPLPLLLLVTILIYLTLLYRLPIPYQSLLRDNNGISWRKKSSLLWISSCYLFYHHSCLELLIYVRCRFHSHSFYNLLFGILLSTSSLSP